MFVEEAFARRSGLTGLVGSYRVQVSKGLGRRSLNIYVEAQSPDLLRVEVLSPTASSEGYLIAGHEEVGLWLAEERRLYRGPSGDPSFARALGLDLTASDAVGLLLGYGAPEGGTSRWDEAERRIRVDAGQHVTGWLHPVTLRFERLRFVGSGPVVEAELADWAEEPAPVPRQIVLEVPDEDMRLRLWLAASWSANPDFPPDSFSVAAPPGTVEVPLESLAQEGGLLRRGLEQ